LLIYTAFAIGGSSREQGRAGIAQAIAVFDGIGATTGVVEKLDRSAILA